MEEDWLLPGNKPTFTHFLRNICLQHLPSNVKTWIQNLSREKFEASIGLGRRFDICSRFGKSLKIENNERYALRFQCSLSPQKGLRSLFHRYYCPRRSRITVDCGRRCLFLCQLGSWGSRFMRTRMSPESEKTEVASLWQPWQVLSRSAKWNRNVHWFLIRLYASLLQLSLRLRQIPCQVIASFDDI